MSLTLETSRDQLMKKAHKLHLSPAGERRRFTFLALGSVLIVPLLFIGCPKNNGPDGPRAGVSTRPATPPSPAAIPEAVAFNGERAMEHARKQVDIGPRPPGTTELAKTREYIIKELNTYGVKVTTDEFHAQTPLGDKTMVNITGEIPGESKDVIIISSHYDSKYFKNMRFVGANDPAASVATLLELARVLSTNGQKPKFTYWLVFFDGEEAFCEGWEECGKPGAPDNTYGSRRYVTRLKVDGKLEAVRALILLDMMGAKDLELGRDDMSSKWLLDIVWQTARELGYGSIFLDRPEGVGGDDHEAF